MVGTSALTLALALALALILALSLAHTLTQTLHPSPSRSYRVADGTLHNAASRAHRVDTEAHVLKVVHGVEDAEHVHAVALRKLTELGDGAGGGIYR